MQVNLHLTSQQSKEHYNFTNIGTGKGWNDPDFLMTGGQVFTTAQKINF